MEIERVNVLENTGAMSEHGVRRQPALAAAGKTTDAVFLTKRKIRRFLRAL